MNYVVGVDGGNTKTIALAADLDGMIRGSGRGGCGDIYSGDSEAGALATIDSAVMAALRSAGARPDGIAAACFSLAGADWPEDFALLHSELGKQDYGQRVIVVNDAIGALRAGSPDGMGVAVVCGTAAATGARGPDGRSWHSSYWQLTHGGEELGRRTLLAVYRAELGLDPPTSLTGRVLASLGAESVEQVLHGMTARGRRPRPRVARLAPVLLDEASAGDATARSIVQTQGEALGDFALVAERKVGLAGLAYPLVLAGGVLRHPSALLRDAIVARVLATSPHVAPMLSRFEPAVGALLLALEAAGVAVDSKTYDCLTRSLPPAELFAT